MIAGVIKESQVAAFTKILYRISRGKVASYFENIGTGETDTESGNILDGANPRDFGLKQRESFSAFVIFFADSDYLRQKVSRVCHSYSANVYEMPKGETEQ